MISTSAAHRQMANGAILWILYVTRYDTDFVHYLPGSVLKFERKAAYRYVTWKSRCLYPKH